MHFHPFVQFDFQLEYDLLLTVNFFPGVSIFLISAVLLLNSISDPWYELQEFPSSLQSQLCGSFAWGFGGRTFGHEWYSEFLEHLQHTVGRQASFDLVSEHTSRHC